MKTLCLFLLLAFTAFAQLRPHTPPDIAGDGVVHSITTDTAQARIVTVKAADTNTTTNCSSAVGGSQTACPRLGDSGISSSRGIALVPGSSYTFPIPPQNSPGWGLASVFYLVQSGDKITVLYGQ